MQQYHFNQSDRVYSHPTTASADNMVDDDFMLVAFATFEALPETIPAGHVARRTGTTPEGDGWEIVEDRRGTIYNTDTKESSEHNELGPLPPGFTHLVPGEFDLWSGTQWQYSESLELETKVEQAVVDVRQFWSLARYQVAGSADQYETAGWADKARRAERYVAGSPMPGDQEILEAEATRRGQGETDMQLAELQLDKAAKFAMAVSVIDGAASAATNALEALTDLSAFDATLATLQAEADIELANLLAEIGA